MKKILLQSITMRNFRGEKERTTNFNPDSETTIMGANGLGKSRHFDAFLWLMFGKDKLDRKDFNVKSVDAPAKTDCEVSATLDVNGETILLRRILTEKWVKPRGQVEEAYKGDETLLFWNDVPVKVGDFNARINELVNDNIFKMITNPMYFPTLDWKLQREQLFQLAGTITDAEIAAKSPEFAALLDKITGKSLADFKREIAARKKRLKEDLVQIQPRIDQTQKLMPETLDFADLERQAADADKEIADIDKAISDKTEAIRQQYEVVQKKQGEINDLKKKQQDVLFNAQTKAREDVYKANKERRNIENLVNVLESDIAALERAFTKNQHEVKELERSIESNQKNADGLRQKWYEENAKEYKENDTCLVCPVFKINCADNSALEQYAKNKDKARASFIALKQSNLKAITENGKQIQVYVDSLKKDAETLSQKAKELQGQLTEQRTALENAKETLASTPKAEPKAVNPEELPEYKTLGDVIKGLESTLDNGTTPIDTTELQNRKKGLQQMRDEIKGRLANRELITKYSGEIKDLEVQGKGLAQKIADVEREEYTIQQFTKARIDECERRINGLFSNVTFKLFDYTIDGNEYETCVPLVGGVPYDVANTAAQVNAGLDIINVLVRFHGVSAPIFVDGRESINRIIPTESQIINLIVSNDKNLIIK
jgi:DNA repair exonuclease SbcCD ATPase subunit